MHVYDGSTCKTKSENNGFGYKVECGHSYAYNSSWAEPKLKKIKAWLFSSIIYL